MSIGAKNICVAGLFAGIAAILFSTPGYGIPAFARKYGLRCSACHEAWPKLNNFGQVFKDNGYQLGNDRDAPIYQDPGYWPASVRMTPQWRAESNSRTAVDTIPGDASSGLTESKVVTSGFDLSGLDLWFAGTLAKNISFQVLPALEDGGFSFESAWVRFGDLLGSKWVNVKVGKFELDTPVSEKRFLALTENGGFFQLYHYIPSSDINSFAGLGENQLGVELMGHSANSYTRYAVSVLSSNSGTPGLPTSRSYDFYGNVNQAFAVGGLGLQRVGAYVYRGQSPTYYQTVEGESIPGTGTGNRPFYRAGAYGIWYLRDLDISAVYMHGQDNVYLATGTPLNQPTVLPEGAQSPTWNGGFVETHYTVTPQFIAIGRYEAIRMSRQAFPLGTELENGATLTSDYGNTDALVGGFRWYPIMNSRAGLALHAEYSNALMRHIAPVTGRNVRSQSVMLGFDFAF
jgi:hypothetical protein